MTIGKQSCWRQPQVPCKMVLRFHECRRPVSNEESMGKQGTWRSGVVRLLPIDRRLRPAEWDAHQFGYASFHFGAGWGRTILPFSPVSISATSSPSNRIQYFVRLRVCRTQRLFVTGRHQPPLPLATGTYDIVLAWSVFTHLPPKLADEWFADIAGLLKPGGLLFISAWGKRFFGTLKETAKAMGLGRDVHWFYRQVVENAGDLTVAEARHARGEVVFIPSTSSEGWGDTIMPTTSDAAPKGLERVGFDGSQLSQDVIVLRKRT